jgi:hypothetical protein
MKSVKKTRLAQPEVLKTLVLGRYRSPTTAIPLIITAEKADTACTEDTCESRDPGRTNRSLMATIRMSRRLLPKRLAMAILSAPRRNAERAAATSGNEVMRATNRVPSIRKRYKTMRRARRQVQNRGASEATLAVLDDQLRSREPLTLEEESFAVTVDTGANVDLNWIWNQVSR